MNKRDLIKQIVAALADNLEVLGKAARASHLEATHESSKAENKYDTRGLEAAYLAGGQARAAKEIVDAIKLYEAMKPRDFSADESIDIGAVVEVKSARDLSTYFIGPKSGGLEVQFEGKEIVVITPQSPLGQNLMEKKKGDRWTADVGGASSKFEIKAVL
ncbi:MAG: GreA/GreB family elongation factor [Limisphaerales bacterium]